MTLRRVIVVALTQCLCAAQHPRLKRPVGRRLAYAAARLLKQQQREHDITLGLAQPGAFFEEDGAVTGPTIAGCRYSNTADAGAALTLQFNNTLLGGEGLMLRPFDANETGGWGGPHEQDNTLFSSLPATTDSSGVMVCTADPHCERPPCGNETTCQCQGWNYIKVGYCNASGCPMTSHWYCEVRINFPDHTAFHNYAVESSPMLHLTKWTKLDE